MRHRKKFKSRLGVVECEVSLVPVRGHAPYLWIQLRSVDQYPQVGAVNGEKTLRALALSILDSLDKREKRKAKR